MRLMMRFLDIRIFNGVVVLLLLFTLFGQPAPVRAAGAVIRVNVTVDEYDPTNNNCSLREAIVAANTNQVIGVGANACAKGTQEVDTIVVPAGTYTLTIPQHTSQTSEADQFSGDLDILADVIIQGAGLNNTIIVASHGDRVFHIGKTGGDAGVVRIDGVEIRGGRAMVENRVEGRGGGVFLERGTLYLSRVMLRNNQSAVTGGAIDNNIFQTLHLSTTTVIGNSASEGGGIYNLGNLFIYSSTIIDNTASATGGGIDTRSDAGNIVSLTNVTIGGNTAAATGGGGIYVNGPLNIYSSTITQNSGTGLRIDSGSINLRNNIIANQKDGSANCSFVQDNPKYQSLGYNLENLNTCKLTVTGDKRDVSLEALKLETTRSGKGGPTQLYALLEGSVAIDSGDDKNCPGSDQRWSIRPVDGDNDLVQRCDIGAYEFGPFTIRKLFLPLITR